MFEPGPGTVEVRDVGVRFLLEHERPVTLKAALVRLLRRDRRMEPFWALRHVDLRLAPGEALAVIGGNGAGKSTLLRAIAGILDPTEGAVVRGGRVLPLIELTAGFLPDLTAHDNVRLNGAVFGLTWEAVRTRLDAIFAFAGLEAFRDVPMRNFSTGMFARLAFALAVHLPADVLLIDEVLAVGDATFQQRGRERLRALVAAGRTLVLVTHDLAAAAELCRQGLVLERGAPCFVGAIDEAIACYQARAPGVEIRVGEPA